MVNVNWIFFSQFEQQHKFEKLKIQKWIYNSNNYSEEHENGIVMEWNGMKWYNGIEQNRIV